MLNVWVVQLHSELHSSCHLLYTHLDEDGTPASSKKLRIDSMLLYYTEMLPVSQVTEMVLLTCHAFTVIPAYSQR